MWREAVHDHFSLSQTAEKLVDVLQVQLFVQTAVESVEVPLVEPLRRVTFDNNFEDENVVLRQ